MTEKSKFKNVLCVYPYYYRNPYQYFPPIAVEYMAGAIEGLVEKVTVIDMRFERDITPYMKGVDLVATFGHYEDCAIFGQLKEDTLNEIAKALPDNVPLITGGSTALDIKRTFDKCPRLDIIIRGNPEYVIREYVRKGAAIGVTNMVYRGIDGNPVYNEMKIHPVSNEILPARRLRKYSYKSLGIECDIIKTSIGCNFKCNFCYQYGKGFDNKFLKWQGRSAESIFNELKTSPGIFIGIIDDDPLVDIEKIERLCDLIIESGMKKMFACTSRLNYVVGKDKILAKMERAGFIGISWGVESFYDRTLKFYKKGTSVELNDKGLKAVARTNMLLAASFVLGSPGETKQDILNYLKYMHKYGIDSAVTNRLRVPKGSELYDVLYDKKTGELLPEWKDKLVDGPELDEVKYAIKYGQRTPLRILIMYLKLARHKGMPIDPLFLLMSGINTIIKGTSLEKFFPARWLVKSGLLVSGSKLWRIINKAAADILFYPVVFINRVWESIDDNLKISITILPVIFKFLYTRVYEKQKLQHGWKNS